MNDADELLERVRQHPHDDAARLAMADALDASDPRRASFVRLCCELARTSDLDPRHAALEADLAHCHPLPEWHSDLARARGLSWRYHRGFVSWMRARADLLIREAETVLAHPVETLVVEAKAREVPALIESGLLTAIRNLTLRAPAKAQHDLLASGALQQLRALTLTSDDRALPRLVKLPVLEQIESLKLVVQGDSREAVRVIAGAGALAGLRHLELRNQPRSNAIHVTTLAGSSVLAGLQSLVLGSLDDAEGAKALSNLQALRSLVVWDIDEQAGPVLCQSAVIARLQRLKLQHASRSAVMALASNPGSVALRQLELGGLLQTMEVIGDEGVEALARSPHLAGLELLDLGGCGMGARGVQALADTAAFPHVRTLDLQGRNQLGVAGAKALARWSSLNGVHTLLLPLEEPDPEAALRLMLDSEALQGVQRLDLWGPHEKSGDAAIQALAGADLPVLSHLAVARLVNKPSFGTKGAKALLTSVSLPALRILWARLKKVAKTRRLALHERYLVIDSESDNGLGSPLLIYRA